MVTRFAPSPTGRLHLGHAYSALLAHDLARENCGRLVLRIEDIDTARCRPQFIDGIVEDLRWLGIDWDGAPVIQSERANAHSAALDRLRDLGLVYRCVCTRAEIAASQSAPHGDDGPVYPGSCRDLEIGPDDPRPVAWRLDVARAGSDLRDDIVLARKGLGVAYHLAAVVDDAAAGVTDVVRGRDLLNATPVQQLLQRLLNLPTPRYHHHRLILGPDGKRLAKRTAGSTLDNLRAAGTDPVRLVDDLRAGRLPVGFGFDHD